MIVLLYVLLAAGVLLAIHDEWKDADEVFRREWGKRQ